MIFWKIIQADFEKSCYDSGKEEALNRRRIAVIGGGAAGIVAALEASRNGAEVTILERNDRIGKKILATGNGKCNLSNMTMEPNCFHCTDTSILIDCLHRFGVKDTIEYFERIGLMIKEKNGYLYPVSEQASVVLDVLRIAVSENGIDVKTDAKVTKVTACNKYGRSGFEVCWDKETAFFDKVILACGSKAAPKTGSDGNGYELAKKMGHRIIPVVPSLVQLKCNDSFCKALAGIRAQACVHIFENEEMLCRETGEVQLTDYGISGIPVFQLSAIVNKRLAEKNVGTLKAVIDFLPDLSDQEYKKLQENRLECMSGLTVEEFFTGMLNKKLMMVFIKLAGLNPSLKVSEVPIKKMKEVFLYCRGLTFHIIGHNGFDNAQICAGGVDLREVTEDMESKKKSGLYFAGEILDVDGRCGGYNLQWAWTSGVIAGRGVCK